MSKSKFAATLFAKIENEGTDEQYLETATAVEELAAIGETVRVAEYRLVDVRPVTVSIQRGGKS